MNKKYLSADRYCLSVRDGTHDTPKPTPAGFKLVTGKHIKNGTITPTDAYYISEDDYNAINVRSLVEQWDVLLSMIGTVGEAAVVTEKPQYAIKNVALFKCGGSETKGKWLAYYLRSNEAKCHMQGNMKGASQQFLSLKQLRALPIPIFPEYRMKKIVDILSAYDDLIENNRKQIKLLEEAAQRLYKEWFIDLRFLGYETTPIVNGVPDGWKKVQLRELIAFNPKIAVTIDTIKTFVPMEALSTSSMVISASEVFETSKNAGSKFEIGDTLLARITPCLENGKTAFVSNIDKGGYGVGSTEFIVLRSEKLNPYIVYLLARTKEFRSYAINSMTGSDGRQRVKVDKLEKYPTLLPSRKVIDLFGRIVAPYFGKVKVLSKAIHSCQEARNYLLPKLMTGELEVK